YMESPSQIVFEGNRAVNNANGGLLLNGASINIPEFGDEVNAVVSDNDLSTNTGNQGYGFRAYILRRDLNAPGNAQSEANVTAVLQNNRIVGNRVGVYIDAGFPYRPVVGGCD